MTLAGLCVILGAGKRAVYGGGIIMMRDMEDANRKRLLDIIQRIPAGTPNGWQKETFAVAGLQYVGFSNIHPEKLVVISSQGQRIIDCQTGIKTACEGDYDEDDLFVLVAELGDEIIPIAGEGGGGLRRYSKGGDTLVTAAPFWPIEKVIYMPNYASYFQDPEKCTVIFDDYELKAFGFSRCGDHMIACNSNTLDIFKRI